MSTHEQTQLDHIADLSLEVVSLISPHLVAINDIVTKSGKINIPFYEDFIALSTCLELRRIEWFYKKKKHGPKSINSRSRSRRS